MADPTENVIEEEQPEAPVVEEAEPPVEEETPEEPETEEPEEEEEPPAQPISRRKELRIQNLLQKLTGESSPTHRPSSPSSGIKYEEQIEGPPELFKTLEADRTQARNAGYQDGVSQAESIRFHTRLEIDAPRVEAKYPQFDKDSASFNPVAADAINRMYLSTVGFDEKTDTVKSSKIRYYDYVESIMELADEMAGEKAAKSSKSIARQAAQTGLRPGSSTPKRLNLNKAPQDMTDEELDAILGTPPTPKKR